MRREDIDQSKYPSKPSYKSSFHEKLRQEQKEQRAKVELDEFKKKELLKSKKDYGKHVTQEYLPKRNASKISQLEMEKQKLDQYNQRKFHLR